jgi:2-succinyl-5-enolpyruvyl-6-hydroxy-3-cyclohexene-1-carboxylate synthase
VAVQSGAEADDKPPVALVGASDHPVNCLVFTSDRPIRLTAALGARTAMDRSDNVLMDV